MAQIDPFKALTLADGKDHAEEYLRQLAASPHQYHIDDDPHDIIVFATGAQVFTNEQCATLIKNMQTIRILMTWDHAWEVYYTAVKAAERRESIVWIKDWITRWDVAAQATNGEAIIKLDQQLEQFKKNNPDLAGTTAKAMLAELEAA